MSKHKFEHHPDYRFAETKVVVEATHNELTSLWSRYEKRCRWDQDMRGFSKTIGKIDVDGEKLPVNVSGFWYEIDYVRVLFYESPSLVTHWGWVKEWIMEACPNAKSVNATNFNNALIEIEDISGRKIKPYVECKCYED